MSDLAGSDPECPCQSVDAAEAAEGALAAPVIEELRAGSHFDISLRRCRCGADWLAVFTELIDFGGGDDSQAWTLVPLTVAAASRLRAVRPVTEGDLVACLGQVRHIMRVWPRGGTLGVSWAEGPLIVLPHD